MDISFDHAKRASNIVKHGLDFADAGAVFTGEVATRLDPRDYGEDRFITAGYLDGHMVVIAWTPRRGSRRIINMRYCHADEELRWLAARFRRD